MGEGETVVVSDHQVPGCRACQPCRRALTGLAVEALQRGHLRGSRTALCCWTCPCRRGGEAHGISKLKLNVRTYS